jgi:undecaprenyl diphosphate synthase
MGLLEDFLVSERDDILVNQIRLVAIGDLDRLPPFVREVLDPLRDASGQNTKMTLALALSYGGQEEIARAARDLAIDACAGRIDPMRIDTRSLASRLPSMGVDEPDLIIRTGGEHRISNFLLFGAAYAELAFTDVLWPDFTEQHFFEALGSYQKRERRFGRLPTRATEPQPSSLSGEAVRV